jgi:tRNA (cytidine/uridine-2'-O-)-methyltransferase
MTPRVHERPYLHVVLYQPEIPANTGNIARLCGAAQLKLHLIHPLGFSVSHRQLKRAGLDYWEEVDICHHSDFQAFLEGMEDGGRLAAFSRHASDIYSTARVTYGQYLLFGPETRGLPLDILGAYPSYCVPIWGNVRSLNLSTTVGIVTYHYLHQMGRL